MSNCTCNEGKVMEVVHNLGTLPAYQTEDSAGMDLHSVEGRTLKPLERALFDTGISVAIPKGYEGQVRPRSGTAWKHGITVLNAPGTIDADYRGPLKVMLINLSDEEYTIAPHERVAQLVITPYAKVEIKPVLLLDETQRGAGGFGSTGK